MTAEEAEAARRGVFRRVRPPKHIFNERVKLLAGNLDRASSACFTVGVATPTAGYLYNVSGLQTSLSLGILLPVGFVWFLAAVGLHYLGRRALGELLP